MIRIISRTEGFRRCGVAHSVVPTDHPDDRFTADELERLIEDPMLVVVALSDDGDEMASQKPGPVAPATDVDGTEAVGEDSSAPVDDSAEKEAKKPAK